MKQKLFLLMVLIAGLVACSKDDDTRGLASNLVDSNKNDSIGNSRQELGDFEGHWIMYNHIVSSGNIITVTENEIQLIIPDKDIAQTARLIYQYNDTLLSNAYPAQRILDQTPIKRTFHYEIQGVSETKTYYNLYYDSIPQYSNVNGEYPIVIGNMDVIMGFPYGSHATWNIGFLANEPGVAIYDRKVNCWILMITLKKTFVDNGEETMITDLMSLPEKVHFRNTYPNLTFNSYKKLQTN